MPTVLVTGANRGIGLGFARHYAADGWRVIATCRDPATAPSELREGGKVELHPLDIADQAAVEALARQLDGTAIDHLICNAGVYGPKSARLGRIDHEVWAQVLRINVMGTLKVCECFTDHVARGNLRVMAAISSKMGSMGDNTSGGVYIYRSSKAALKAVMKSLARDLKPRGIVVAILHPGWVRTDMGGPNALIDVDESVSGMRRVLARTTPETSGRFLDYRGGTVPW